MKIIDLFIKGLEADGIGLRFWELLSICGYIVGLLGIAVYAAAEGSFLTTFGVLMLVGTAAWLSGGALGFLFGVPRLRAAPGQAQTAQSANSFVPNTNLEQISDWLTKILVGATLVQLKPIAADVNALALDIGRQIGTKGGPAVSGGVMILYFAAGFMWGYLWCSLRVFKEMSALTERAHDVAQPLNEGRAGEVS